MIKHFLQAIVLLLTLTVGLSINAQTTSKQKGLLWQISGNGLKKPSYVYGTMHVSQKIAFHLGDSFYLALSKADVVALEQDLDSVIHRWITENELDDPEDASKVYPRNTSDYLNLYNFTLNSYNKFLIQRKLSAEVREVNYLLTRGDQDDFEENAWLDLYIYQIAKKLGKGFTGVEGYEESRDLVKKSQKEPKDSKKKPRKYNYKLRQQVAEAYRKGDIFMLDSIDRMTESEHYLEYMLYRRNANMVRRMDSIMHLGKTMFTGVGCSHLPGAKGVLQLLIEKGYTVRPVQSIALEKSKMAKKYENMTMKHKYTSYKSDDGLITATLPTRLTKVADNSYYSSYLSPDLANGYYYQIEKIACNTIFSGKSPEDVLLVIDTLIFENIPGEITEKRNIVSNGFDGMEVVTKLKTGDLNRFQILASPFNVYIIRMSGKKNFAISSEANTFFKSLKIDEGNASGWRKISSPDSVFSLELPSNDKHEKLTQTFKANPSFEHLVYDKMSGNTYLIKQEDILNENYIEQDTFELDVMAKSFAATDNFNILSKRHFDWQGYYALDAEFENKNKDKMLARFVICGSRYIMFVLKPNGNGGNFNDKFFNSIHFNGKPTYQYFDYTDTSLYFTVKTPVLPLLTKTTRSLQNYYYNSEDDEDDKVNKYKGVFKEEYFVTSNANEFITVGTYKYGYYESQYKNPEEYFKSWKKKGSLKLVSEKRFNRKGVDYVVFEYTDTNTTRRFRQMHALHGQMRYYIEAYLDTVSGKNDFVETFYNTFDVSDTILNDDIFTKKGYRFFEDFTSKDSVRRKASIKNFDEVSFNKRDIANLCNVIDTISMKGDAAQLRTALINTLSNIDSSQAIIIPYLQKLYNRFSDTAYMQIEILQAMAKQKNDKAFNAIKPILASDIPISDDAYDMREMLFSFSDSLKLTKIILPELIELTNITEYRNTAYSMISRMKDSGIINENDYASIHDKLVKETRIEYKRMMASLTKEELSSKNEFFGFGQYQIGNYVGRNYNTSDENEYSLFSDILDLSLPLRAKNAIVGDIVKKILKITDNEQRLSLLPVLVKYNIHFEDSVYETLAKNKNTRLRFYTILAEAKKLDKFPKAYMNHRDWIMADIYGRSDNYSKVDSVVILHPEHVIVGKDTTIVYVCKFKMEDEDDWILYFSEALPLDSNVLNTPDTRLAFESKTELIQPEVSIEKMTSDVLFENLLMHTRQRNGGYYDSYSYRRSNMNSYMWDY